MTVWVSLVKLRDYVYRPDAWRVFDAVIEMSELYDQSTRQDGVSFHVRQRDEGLLFAWERRA